MKHSVRLVILTVLLCATVTAAWTEVSESFRVNSLRLGLGANDLGTIAWDGKTLWVTGSGTLTNLIGDGHNVYDWISYENMEGFGRGTISAFYASGDTLVAAWLYNDDRGGGDVFVTGDGFSISTDHGVTWRHITILHLFPERSSLKYPGTYTLAYDIRMVGNTLWCATTYGFLLKTQDMGLTWTHVLPDSGVLDFGKLNHHGYSVDVYADTLWVGTIQGINASFDNGKTWKNFSWPLDGSGKPEDQWPGNAVYAVEHKVAKGKTHIWVGSVPEYNTGLGVYGICHTDDNGATWRYKTTKYNAYNFAFGHDGANNPKVSDETVLAASDSGLGVSYDLGETWDVIAVRDTVGGKEWEPGSLISSVRVVNDTLWVTSSDGIARSNDWGQTWEIFKGITRVRTLDTGNRNIGISSNLDNVETYAFPNPFSPKRSDRDYSRTRIQYSLENDATISISIYDYNGRMIKKIIDNEYRSGGRDYQEPWNGTDNDNVVVPNGVYFYVIKTDKGDTARGKIMVLD